MTASLDILQRNITTSFMSWHWFIVLYTFSSSTEAAFQLLFSSSVMLILAGFSFSIVTRFWVLCFTCVSYVFWLPLLHEYVIQTSYNQDQLCAYAQYNTMHVSLRNIFFLDSFPKSWKQHINGQYISSITI